MGRILQTTINQIDKIDALTEEALALYLREDLEGIVRVCRLDETLFAPEDRAWARQWMRSLLELRNRRMLSRMIPRLKQGGTFIAVGAAHLGGREGLLALLKHKGYRLTPIPVHAHQP